MKYFTTDPDNLHYHRTLLQCDLSIYELFLRAYQCFDRVIFLESQGEYSAFSRYSILLFEPKQHIRAQGNILLVDEVAYEVKNPFDELREFSHIHIDEPGYCGGLFGYISYEGTRYFDSIAHFHNNTLFDDFEFGLFLDGIVYDKMTGELFYFTVEEDRQELVKKIIDHSFVPGTFSFEELGSNMSQAVYTEKIAQAKEHIASGDIFQVVLSAQFLYKLHGDVSLVYHALRQINPSPYLSYIKFSDREIITSSVDLVTRVTQDPTGLIGHRIENFPLAGTTVRGKTPQEDDDLFVALLNDEKERAEHMMLVDLGRNDIGRVCKFHSVRVTEFMVPKRFSHVQHIESKIEGEIREDKDAFDCVKATSPMGTVSGAPKIEAMKIIHALEDSPRGPYSGELGGFMFNKNCIFSVGLRSLFVSGDVAYTQVGSGIVHDSTAEYEYQEILRKKEGMTAAMLAAQNGGKR